MSTGRTPTRRTLQQAGLLLGTVAALALPIQAFAGAVPIKGRDVGTFTATPGGICAAQSLQVDITGTGTAGHVGRYSFTAGECFNPAAGTFAGTFVVTAANGDTLVGSYRGQVSATADPDVAAYAEDAVVTGGTGHFAGASGNLEIHGLANLATGGYSQQLSGTISSVGSAKKK